MNALFKTDFYRMTGNEWKVNLSNICKTIFYKGIMPSEKGFRFSSGL